MTKQKKPYLTLEDTLNTINVVVSKYKRKGIPLNWNVQPLSVVFSIIQESFEVNEGQHFVPYNEVTKLLRWARSPKLGGNMNIGLNEITETLRQKRFTTHDDIYDP